MAPPPTAIAFSHSFSVAEFNSHGSILYSRQVECLGDFTRSKSEQGIPQIGNPGRPTSLFNQLFFDFLLAVDSSVQILIVFLE